MSWAVKFEGVSKRYRGGGPRYGSLRHDLSHGFKQIGRLFSRTPNEAQGKLALDDVSFEIQQGESFSIIGPNGAGKTTALKLISRISYPTIGRIRVRGRVGALIEVGSAVHPELTARENIWLYGQILGMTKADIRRRFDEIVGFAELTEVLETPVKMYSSGMQLRLGFAIASHLDPEVFVVDEALAVGDAGFQAKCVERMTSLVKEGRTLLFVSHNLSAIEAICKRALFLVNGQAQVQGDTSRVLKAYLDWVEDAHQARLANTGQRRSSSSLRLESVTCHGNDGAERYAFHTWEDVEVRLRFTSLVPLERPMVSIGVTDGRPGDLILCSMLVDGGSPERLDGDSIVSCRLRALPLLPRVYQLWCSVRSNKAYGDLFDWQQVGAFRICETADLNGPTTRGLQSVGGPILVSHSWKVISARDNG
jgi:ABC-type polysaccharide/polyol phosphate transport system ATPase subunit